MRNYYTIQKDWESFRALFEKMNHTQEYVVLRNWENYYDDLSVEGKSDIDILCENRQKFADALGAARLNRHTYNYAIRVEGKDVFLDLRSPGDGYYCKEWELAMLKERQKHSLGFYIMDDENYFYSLLYHVLIHKTMVTVAYQNKLQLMMSHIFEETVKDDMVKQLNEFMRFKRYRYSLCSDHIPGIETQINKIYIGGV